MSTKIIGKAAATGDKEKKAKAATKKKAAADLDARRRLEEKLEKVRLDKELMEFEFD